MACEPLSDQLVVAAEAVAHFKAARIEPRRFQADGQRGSADQRAAEIGAAVNDR